MRVTHNLIVFAICPANEARVDAYATTVEVDRFIAVEEIMEVAASYRGEAVWQEDLTKQLAGRLRARIITVGEHSGVKTTCEAP